jgi:hypothetical protein
MIRPCKDGSLMYDALIRIVPARDMPQAKPGHGWHAFAQLLLRLLGLKAG